MSLSALVLTLVVAHAAEPPPGGWPPPPTESTVASVYDGDTVTLSTGDKIRLRWVNTPERKPPEPFAEEARAATLAFVTGRTVRLILANENPRDGYGRVVAGIETDQGNLSEHLLREGLAHLFVIPPDDTDLSALVEAQRLARAENKGIWTTPSYQGALHITSFHANAPGDDRENVNGEYLRVCNVAAEPVDLSAFRLTDADGHSWTLPAITLPPGHTVKIHSGKGDNQSDPAQQITVYLGSDDPVWGNDGDTATLLDGKDKVVDQRVHGRK